MFTFSGRFRRRVAVLSVLSLLASVLVVAAPAVAADPKADYKATFSACVGAAAEDADFTDVLDTHANAGDINCIAYYGVTRGTSASAYSPLMFVTREQMALFLTRLASLVGIDVPADPADPGFTDTGDLSGESQTAIARLAALGITKGNNASGTTYGPSENVTRDHMALFISRLMREMKPQADGEIGLSSTSQFGFTPSDVEDNDMDADVLSPFQDIRPTTKEEWDAITHLYELGVASGASGHATSYAPDAFMTRAAMAGFMAAVLDHSNARPAGLSIQSDPAEGWGDVPATVLVSVRDDTRDPDTELPRSNPVEDQPVDVFSSASANDGLREDGTCNFGPDPDDVNFGDFVNGDCMWSDNDSATDVDGNLILDEDVDQGETRVFYAWIGAEDGDEFDSDTADEQTTSVKAKKEQSALKVTSTINKYADAGYGEDLDRVEVGYQSHGPKVDLGEVDEVTFTAQLQDDEGADVKRAGIEVRVEYTQDNSYLNTHEAVRETDENGQVSYTIKGLADNPRVNDQSRADDVIFHAEDLTDTDGDSYGVYWFEEDPVLTTSTIEVPTYVLAGQSSSIRATVHLWDQYGNPHQSHRSQKTVITIGADAVETVTDPAAADSKTSIRPVISRGYASWRHVLTTTAGTRVNVVYDVRMLPRNSKGQAVKGTVDEDLDDNNIAYNDGRVITADGDATAIYDSDNNALPRPGASQRYRNILAPDTTDQFTTRATLYNGETNADTALNKDGSDMVEVVNKALSTNISTASDRDVVVTHALEGEFLADTDASPDGDADLVYSYNDDDIFIDSTGAEGVEITMDSFAAKIKDGGNTVEVLAYDVDGVSIFRLTS